MEHCYILTGPMGSGKTALANQLELLGVKIIAEPARIILDEQRRTGGSALPDKNPQQFCEFMLQLSIENFQDQRFMPVTAVFDRGIPDVIAYAEMLGVNSERFRDASKVYVFNPKVFMLPAWEEIYTTDEERTMSFEESAAFGTSLVSVYQELGYEICDVPKSSLEDRAEFVRNLLPAAEEPLAI